MQIEQDPFPLIRLQLLRGFACAWEKRMLSLNCVIPDSAGRKCHFQHFARPCSTMLLTLFAIEKAMCFVISETSPPLYGQQSIQAF